MPGGVVGREPELQAAARCLEGLRSGAAALLFEGEPGIGKSTVLAEAVERARGEFCVLSARPAEVEAPLAFAALADLLEPVVDGVLAGLPAPQRHALGVALLREEPGARPLDQHSVCAATLSVFRALAATRQVLISVDDLQWLDRPSARVLEFAVRRLGELPVGVLACQRLDNGGAAQLNLERVFPDGRCTRIRLGPLSLAALHQVLSQRLQRSLPRRTLVRVAHAVGGNPLFAVELVRVLPDELPAAAVLELPETLRQLVANRIAALPTRTREVLLAAAAVSAPTAELVTSAAPGRAADALRALEHAVAAGVISTDDSLIRFNHPLFASGVYWSAPSSERRKTHLRLARLTDDVEERARHLALGSSAPDARRAAVVARAAEHARRRGAPGIAAGLAEHARALTPPGHTAEHQRRSVQLAEYLVSAGEPRRAREMLAAVLRRAAPGPGRADVLRLLGEICYQQDSFPEGIRLFEQALGQAGNDRAMKCAIELSLAFGSVITGEFAAVSPHAHRALEFAEQAGERAALAEALAAVAMADFLLGRGLDEEKIDRALRLEDPHHQVPVLLRPSLIAGYLALYEGKLQRSSSILGHLRDRIIEGGEESALPSVSSYLGWSASWRGALREAAGFAAEAVDCAERIGADPLRCWALAFAAVPAAYSGEEDMARSRAGDCLALAARIGDHVSVLWANWALALLALSQDDARAADAALGPLTATFEDHVPDPVRAFFLPDAIEALIALGRLERAERLLAAFGEAARRQERPWALMLAARCHALLLAARGDVEAAAAAAREALRLGAELELRIEVARTFLAAGRIERRRRAKTLAADCLRQALELFEDAGASLWAQRARSELLRVGLRAAGSGGLTASERKVAELAASGLTNREVAAQLFMSPKTVEANMTHVYRKLGIRSRAELGARLAHLGSVPAQT